MRSVGLRMLLSAAGPFVLAAALVPARGDVPNTTVALALALAVAVLAASGTLASAACAALSAGVSFDLLYTRPYGSLAINRPQDIETTVLLLAVGLVVGELAARNQTHRQVAAASSYDIGRLHAVSEMVAGGEPIDQVILAVGNELTDLLGLLSCQFTNEFAERPGPFIERHGGVSWGALRWGFDTIGLPARDVTLTVESRGRPFGRFILRAAPGTRVALDQLLTAVALADQAGAALAANSSPT